MLIEEGPRWNNRQERESCPSQANVESMLDILADDAHEECDDTGHSEQGICDVFGQTLALEVLAYAGQVLVLRDTDGTKVGERTISP